MKKKTSVEITLQFYRASGYGFLSGALNINTVNKIYVEIMTIIYSVATSVAKTLVFAECLRFIASFKWIHFANGVDYKLSHKQSVNNSTKFLVK